MIQISWDDFMQVELRAGTIVAAEPFPQARKPAWKLTVDFGADIGARRSSAQLTALYQPKQLGPFVSECLVTGLYREDGTVVLAVPDQPVRNGARLA